MRKDEHCINCYQKMGATKQLKEANKIIKFLADKPLVPKKAQEYCNKYNL